MTQDYKSHPSELKGVKGGHAQTGVEVKALREAIPAHCFKPLHRMSIYYIARDVALVASLGYLACNHIPSIHNEVVRWICWLLYGFFQGVVFTGLWVIGHECGHGAQFSTQKVNDAFGFLIHSALLTPYFSWKCTHRRHHIYANNMSKDLHYVPPRREDYLGSLWTHVENFEELTEDAPAVTLLRLTLQQIVGWPLYLLLNITAAPTSLPKESSTSFLGNSHFAPTGALFNREDALPVLLSDLGILCTLSGLFVAGALSQGGWEMVALVYLQPYLWLNHWIVAITYLQHTDPDVPKYDSDAWTFTRGATATVDRSLGWMGREMMHGIADYHVVHHLFSTIPYYHAEEATKAIIPLLGKSYHSRKEQNFMHNLWTAFTKCQYVDTVAGKEPGTLWYRAGPSPGPEYTMGKKLWAKASS